MITDQQINEELQVDAFTLKMKAKLTKHREHNPDSWTTAFLEDLGEALQDAVDDGDWVSVANYAMMLDAANI